MALPDFADAFALLTDHQPFPWQCRLYERFLSPQGVPSACLLPTGLGKTSVLAIWLLALARDPKCVPRRLVYVVNRRTVVDQSSDEAVKLRNHLHRVPGLVDALKDLCACPTEMPLAISTLRGQFADNGEWRNDPARPAIVAGTVDMIGSRLLFSGYNVGFKTRPLHAGLLGCGTLLVHDEAHLEPAFQQLLDAIVQEQQRCESGSLRVMQLTATVRGSGTDVFELEDADRADVEIQKRIYAVKQLRIHEVTEKEVTDRLIQLALQHKDSGRAILVFARTVDAVEKIAAKLGKNVETLTGTMRGRERDRLPERPVFRRFLLGTAPQDGETVYLLCTSAGEVGVNLSADHLVCDLSTFDSMAQRFGRVNRFGVRTDTIVDVVVPTEFKEDDPFDNARRLTGTLLRELGDCASPDRLRTLDSDRRIQAFAPMPEILHVGDILFDAWSMTTIREAMPGRPPVAEWLHGKSEWEPPRTQVAWREEVARFEDHNLKQYAPREVLEDYPLKPHELLSDRTDRVFKHLERLAERAEKSRAWVIDEEGEVEVIALGVLVQRDRAELEGMTVLLSPSIGGLSDAGMLDSSSTTATDVADDWWVDTGRTKRRRLRDFGKGVTIPPDLRLVKELDPREGTESEEDEEGSVIWRWYVRPADGEDENGSRVLKGEQKEQELAPHNKRVGELAELIARKLHLGESLVRVAGVAGRGHDLGKHRDLWQRSIGNLTPDRPLAKSGSGGGPRWRTGYRHEFGSLSDVTALTEFQALSAEERERVLHLIAAHHGRGRPHFPAEEAFDLCGGEEGMRRMALEVPLRFAALQRQVGRWRLAMLESIVRAADYLASEESQS